MLSCSLAGSTTNKGADGRHYRAGRMTFTSCDSSSVCWIFHVKLPVAGFRTSGSLFGMANTTAPVAFFTLGGRAKGAPLVPKRSRTQIPEPSSSVNRA